MRLPNTEIIREDSNVGRSSYQSKPDKDCIKIEETASQLLKVDWSECAPRIEEIELNQLYIRSPNEQLEETRGSVHQHNEKFEFEQPCDGNGIYDITVNIEGKISSGEPFDEQFQNYIPIDSCDNEEPEASPPPTPDPETDPNDLGARIEELKSDHVEQLEEQKSGHVEQLEELKSEHNDQIKKLKADYEASIQVLATEKSELEELSKEADPISSLALILILLASLASFVLGVAIKRKSRDSNNGAMPETNSEPSEKNLESKLNGRSTESATSSVTKKTTAIKESTISDPVIGEPSTFRSVPWWQSEWWNLDPKGHNGDITCDFGNFEDISIIGSSIRGDDHRYDGTRCDDSFYFVQGETSEGENFIVACVCDGVGQSKYSSYSSKLSSYLFTRKLAATIKSLDFDHVRQKANNSLSFTVEQVAEWSPGSTFLAPHENSAEVPVSELQTTLTFAVIQTTPADEENSIVFYGNIGDSPIFILDKNIFTRLEETESTDEDPSTEIVDSSTQGIFTTKEFNFFQTELPPKSALVLVTDGVGNFLTFNDQILPVGKYLGEAWQAPLHGTEFVSSLMFDFRTATDDRTAVVCWLNPKD